MATLWRSYRSKAVARDAVNALKTAGVPARDLRLFAGSRQHDRRDEPVGEFAGRAGPSDPVGTFGNVPRLRRQGAGSFAGAPDLQRQGSFGDSNGEVVVEYDHGGEHSRVASDVEIRRLLLELGIDDDAAEVLLGELHSGSVVVLAEVAPIAPSDAQGRLDGVSAVAA
jgi:hypothetical protein